MDAHVDARLVEELRRIFFDGATPSRLMKHIAENSHDERRTHILVSLALDEAFDVCPVRNVSAGDTYEADKRHAHFNRDLIPEMVAGLPATSARVPEGSWLDGLSITTLRENVERLKNYRPPELDRVWDLLNDRERGYIGRSIAAKDHNWQVMTLLAALAERLQAKLAAAEAQRGEPVAAANGAAAHVGGAE